MTLPFGSPPFAPAPTPKPTILDRLLGRLFPTAQYTGLLDPSQQQALQQQGLRQLSANLLVAGGASPMQRGTLANIGASLGGVDVNALADRALQVQAYRQQQAAQQQVGQVMAANAPKADETREDTYNRLLRITAALPGIPGTEKLLGDLSNVLAQIKPPNRKTVLRPALVNPTTGLVTLDPRQGVVAVVTFDAETGEQIGRAQGGAPPPGGAGGIHPYSTGPGEPIYNIAPGPSGAPVATPVTIAGAPGQAPGQVLRKLTLSPTEREAAERAKDALGTFVNLFNKDETAAVTPMGTAFLEGVGHVADKVGAGGLVSPSAQKSRTVNQQAFQRAAVQLRHNAAALSPHARLQLGFLEDINKAYVPPAGTSAQTIREQYLPEWQNLLRQMNDLLGTSSDTTGNPFPQRP